jgi:hypothetical protein
MKKVAICYKGVFAGQRIVNSGFDEKVYTDALQNIKDHKEKIGNRFKEFGYDIDYYMSTYNINEKLNSVYIEELNPKCYSFLTEEFLFGNFDNWSSSSWNYQFSHYKNLISKIKNENIKYDLFVFTRPDLKLNVDLEKIYSLLDLNKFNIPVQHHVSKNCDDNLFIFPEKYLNKFEECIDTLMNKNGITHEINHVLNENNVNINWMCEYMFDEEYLHFGHNLFSFFR